MAQITLYGTPISTYVRTVRLLLEQAGVSYDLKSIGIFNGENQASEYLAKHPFGKVPTLEVDGEVIYETSAITGYLDTVVANHKFSPADPLTRARMQQIMAIIDSYLYAPVIGTIVIQRLIAIAPATTALEAIEPLTVGGPYLLGGELSIADFFLIPIFVYFPQTPEFNTITAQAPKLQAWWKTVSELPVVKQVYA